jgi:hypothetical protein
MPISSRFIEPGLGSVFSTVEYIADCALCDQHYMHQARITEPASETYFRRDLTTLGWGFAQCGQCYCPNCATPENLGIASIPEDYRSGAVYEDTWSNRNAMTFSAAPLQTYAVELRRRIIEAAQVTATSLGVPIHVTNDPGGESNEADQGIPGEP